MVRKKAGKKIRKNKRKLSRQRKRSNKIWKIPVNGLEPKTGIRNKIKCFVFK